MHSMFDCGDAGAHGDESQFFCKLPLWDTVAECCKWNPMCLDGVHGSGPDSVLVLDDVESGRGPRGAALAAPVCCCFWQRLQMLIEAFDK